MITDFVNIQMFGDFLTLGSVGLVVGVLFPLIFRLIGYVIDFIWVVIS